eukprot:m.344418 g.344418  ORF g.344418 m.344418 type:complete len:514 (+) comp55791_c0_seq1:129-1670(+)
MLQHLFSLKSPPDAVNARDRSGFTPLLLAAKRGSITCFEMLENVGADLFMLPAETSHLHEAAETDQADMVQFLLKHPKCQRNVDFRSSNELPTALMRAAKGGSIECLELILAARADPTLLCRAGSVLHFALENRHTVMLERLLKIEAIRLLIDARDREGRAALMKALKQTDAQAVKLLLDAGADLSVQDNSGQNALHVAATYGSTSTLHEVLSASEAELNQQDEEGKTPLLCAADSNFADDVELLLDAGADASLADQRARIVLHYSAQFSDVELIRRLLTAFPEGVNLQDEDGYTPLMAAVFCGNYKDLFEPVGGMEEWELAHGWEPELEQEQLEDRVDNSPTRDLEDPASDASEEETDEGEDPLIERISGNIRALLDAGANLRLANMDGLTARDLARKYRVAVAVRLLQEHERFLDRLKFLKPAALPLEDEAKPSTVHAEPLHASVSSPPDQNAPLQVRTTVVSASQHGGEKRVRYLADEEDDDGDEGEERDEAQDTDFAAKRSRQAAHPAS